jgi:arylesterase / paraoxonase
MKSFIKWTIISVLALTALRFSWVLASASGVFEDYTVTQSGQCQPVTVSAGTEDVTIDDATGQVFISADNRRNPENLDGNGIYMFPIDKPEDVRKVSLDAPADFHPHGISLWKSEDGERRLFVISHASTGEQLVEVFDVISDGTLKHAETISDPLIHSPNDLVATGERSFYVTNDHRFTEPLKSLEVFLGLPVSDVVYFDGQSAKSVIHNLAYPNGINISADGKTLYVAEIMKRHIRAWNRQADGSFMAGQAWPMRMAADNIEIDEAGNLWTAGHPNILAFPPHSEDPANLSPSMASTVDPKTNEVKEVFYNTGDDISAASVAAYSQGTLVIGAVFEEHVLVCNSL